MCSNNVALLLIGLGDVDTPVAIVKLITQHNLTKVKIHTINMSTTCVACPCYVFILYGSSVGEDSLYVSITRWQTTATAFIPDNKINSDWLKTRSLLFSTSEINKSFKQ